MTKDELVDAVLGAGDGWEEDCKLDNVIDMIREGLVEHALRENEGNTRWAAEWLGVGKDRMAYLIRHMESSAKDFRPYGRLWDG